MSVLDYIDDEMLGPVYQNKLPTLKSSNVNRICKELFYAIKANEEIFIYGDYDMDGFSSASIWREVLSTLYSVPPSFFHYQKRTHNIDPDILRQVRDTKARIVIICDTGSSIQDRMIIHLLRMDRRTPIVIDHHIWEGNYKEDTTDMLVYNSYEERDSLAGAEISGAYSSLLVASKLCEDYFKHSLSYKAMVYALASMYADVVDLATPPGRALYNVVNSIEMPVPVLIESLNAWNYSICRRLFSLIICPRINACFRTERFDQLNAAWTATTKYDAQRISKEISDIHTESMTITRNLIPLFTREHYGNITFCLHTLTPESKVLHIRNYTGLIANKIAQEEKSLVVVAIEMDGAYEGSYRDFYNRRLLDMFGLFCEVGGHDSAFGLKFYNLTDMRKYLKSLSTMLDRGVSKDYNAISSTLVQTSEDIDVLAVYNEYMNVRPRVMVTHRCSQAKQMYSTKYRKNYDVGLPYNVISTLPLLTGSSILVEPTISKTVELRCIE